LTKDSSNYCIRYIGFEYILTLGIVVGKKRGAKKAMPELLEGYNILCIKVKGIVIIYQAYKGYSNTTVVPDKAVVEVAKSEERLDAFYSTGSLLASNYLDLFGIDLNSISTDNKSEIFRLFDTKLILLDIGL
jgi:hypothetical protein